MNPLILYLCLVSGAVFIGLMALAVIKPHQRRCPGCDENVAMAARGCRGCGYAFR